MKILFITSNRVGDAVLSTGVLNFLIEKYPSAAVTVASGPYAAGLFRAVPGLEQLVILRKQSWNRHWIGLWKNCFHTRWDLIVDLRNSLISRLLRSKALISHKKHPELHKVEELAASVSETLTPLPHIWLDDAAEKEAAYMLPVGHKYVALGPAANWPPKQWPVEYFLKLSQVLTADGSPLHNARIVVFADTRERDQLSSLVDGIVPDRRVEVIGRDLLLVAACLKRCDIFIGNDSGLMHLAAAVGTKTLGLFGPGYENIYSPYGPHAAFVRTPEPREELLSRLPNLHAREPNLMTSLSVDKVFEAVLKLMKA